MGVWKIYCHGGLDGEVYRQYEELDLDAQIAIETTVLALKDKDDWRDSKVDEYQDLTSREGDDCGGLGRIEIRMPGQKPGRKYERVLKVVGEPNHEDQTFLILAFSDRGAVKGQGDKDYYANICTDCDIRLKERRKRGIADAEIF